MLLGFFVTIEQRHRDCFVHRLSELHVKAALGQDSAQREGSGTRKVSLQLTISAPSCCTNQNWAEFALLLQQKNLTVKYSNAINHIIGLMRHIANTDSPPFYNFDFGIGTVFHQTLNCLQ